MTSKYTIILAGVLLLNGIAQTASAGVDFQRINGAYEIQMIPDVFTQREGKESFHDKLTINNLNVSLDNWVSKGFYRISCSFQQGMEFFTFQCSEASKEGILFLIGVFQTDVVSGMLLFVEHGGQILKYTFAGDKKI
jgi:hypothetical protein